MDLPKTPTSPNQTNDQPIVPAADAGFQVQGGMSFGQGINPPAQPADQPVKTPSPVGQSAGSTAKEGEPAVSVPEGKEFPISERLMVPEIPPGIERVEAIAGAEITLPQPVTDDTGQVVLDDAAPQQIAVTLPLTEEEMTTILKLKIKVEEAGLWLAERAKMLVKKVGGKFIYQYKNQESKIKITG